MIPIVAGLVQGGLSLLGNAFLAKGKDWVEEKTGVKLDSKGKIPDADMLKLRQFEMAHEEELLKIRQEDNRLELDTTIAYLASVDSARVMQGKALEQEDKFSKRFLYYYAAAWSLAAIIYIGCISFLDIPSVNRPYVNTILGFLLGTVVSQIIQFFFGSSKSSQNKDAALHQAAMKGTGNG